MHGAAAPGSTNAALDARNLEIKSNDEAREFRSELSEQKSSGKGTYNSRNLTVKIVPDHISKVPYPPKADHFAQLYSHKLLERTQP